MRRVLIPALLAVLFAAGSAVRADEVQAIIEKAIKAHGGADKVARESTTETKTKGTLEIVGQTLPFTEEATVQQPNQLKSVVQLEVMGQNVTITTVFDKDKGWVQAPGQGTVEMKDNILTAMKEQLAMMAASKLTSLGDRKKVEVSLIGDDKVNGKDVVGLRVAPKDHKKEISLYFDKKTGLLAKVSWRPTDMQTGQEVGEERIIQEYQDIDGLKVPKKVVVNRDGKKLMELEVQEFKVLDKVDDSTFAKP
jgi:hypothetical protein